MLKELREKVNVGLQEVKVWVSDHKTTLIALSPYATALVVDIIIKHNRSRILKEQKHLKENYIYDSKNGHYYELKRKPTSSEWIQIDERKRTGDCLGHILRDAKLLK